MIQTRFTSKIKYILKQSNNPITFSGIQEQSSNLSLHIDNAVREETASTTCQTHVFLGTHRDTFGCKGGIVIGF